MVLKSKTKRKISNAKEKIKRTIAFSLIPLAIPLASITPTTKKPMKDINVEKIEKIKSPFKISKGKIKIRKTYGQRIVEQARRFMKIKYNWGGRMTKKNPGLDCLGLVFRVHEKVFGVKWTELSVKPSKLSRQLGKRISIENWKNINIKNFEEGDYIFLLSREKLPGDVPVGRIDGKDMYVWHLGIYSEKGNWIHADPDKGVVEGDFKTFLKEYGYDGFMIIRGGKDDSRVTL